MTQAISVYISKAISGPELLLLNLEQLKYVTNTTIWIYGIKLLKLKIFDVSHLFYI